MPNPKCPICKCYITEPEMKSSGEVFKTCKRCRDNSKKYRDENAGKIKKYQEENVDKLKGYKKKYQEENVNKIKERNKKYYDENADKISEKMKKYREENKCEHNKGLGYCSICNLPLYLIKLQRSNIWRCLKLSSQSKTKSSIEYLGCDADYLIEYFKKKMDIYNELAEVKMEWENIHIDHIKPVSSFNLNDEDEFLDCCNYTNLQPLLAKDNLSKNAKWTDEDDKYWNENIKGKEHLEIFISAEMM